MSNSIYVPVYRFALLDQDEKVQPKRLQISYYNDRIAIGKSNLQKYLDEWQYEYMKDFPNVVKQFGLDSVLKDENEFETKSSWISSRSAYNEEDVLQGMKNSQSRTSINAEIIDHQYQHFAVIIIKIGVLSLEDILSFEIDDFALKVLICSVCQIYRRDVNDDLAGIFPWNYDKYNRLFLGEPNIEHIEITANGISRVLDPKPTKIIDCVHQENDQEKYFKVFQDDERIKYFTYSKWTANLEDIRNVVDSRLAVLNKIQDLSRATRVEDL